MPLTGSACTTSVSKLKPLSFCCSTYWALYSSMLNMQLSLKLTVIFNQWLISIRSRILQNTVDLSHDEKGLTAGLMSEDQWEAKRALGLHT